MVRIVSLSFLTPRTCYTETNIVAEHIKCFTHLCDVHVCVCLRERERLTLDSICDQQCALELVTIASNFNFDTIQIFLICSICKIKIITAY